MQVPLRPTYSVLALQPPSVWQKVVHGAKKDTRAVLPHPLPHLLLLDLCNLDFQILPLINAHGSLMARVQQRLKLIHPWPMLLLLDLPRLPNLENSPRKKNLLLPSLVELELLVVDYLEEQMLVEEWVHENLQLLQRLLLP